MVAHTLGNPINLEVMEKFCKDNNLWLILDSCDALGSKYKGKYLEQYGDISTHSYFPAHIITGGQAGAVLTNNSKLYDIMISMSEWGRKYDCRKCGKCKNRFSRVEKHDCRYIFQHLGFNLRPTDMQASILTAQIDKLDLFIEDRKDNWNYLYNNLKSLNEYFIFQKAEDYSEPNWFSFLITIKNTAKFNRNDIVQYLEKNNIETRMFFSGNICRQDIFSTLKLNEDYYIINNLDNTDIIMDNSFFVGVYSGMTRKKLDFMIEKIKEFVSKNI
jgi:CDP-6-deoxy-D-xylo-4-hexulose-3-dehydrase